MLTFKSKTHRSQHFLLIGIPFNAILSRELLPLQKYAGGGAKSQKWEWWRLWLWKKGLNKDDESTEKSKLIGSRLTGNQPENITNNKLKWPSSPHFPNVSSYFYLYPCLQYFPYPYVICFPVMKGEKEKAAELQDNDTGITLQSLPAATYLLSHSFMSLMKHWLIPFLILQADRWRRKIFSHGGILMNR